MKQKSDDWEEHQLVTTLPIFIKNYNKDIPEGFPVATVDALKKFQLANPALFKNADEWSIDRHRKKLMDWLFTYSVQKD